MKHANWIPDLLMKRVAGNGHWTLFNPATCLTCTPVWRGLEQGMRRYEAIPTVATSSVSSGGSGPTLTAQSADDQRHR